MTRSRSDLELDPTKLSRKELFDLRARLQQRFVHARQSTPLDIASLEDIVAAARRVKTELAMRDTQPRGRLIGIRPWWSKEKRLLR